MSNMNFMTNRGSRSRRRGVIFILLFAVLLSGSFSADAQVIVDDNGKVGIGTTSPATTMHIRAPNARFRFDSEEAGTNDFDLVVGGWGNYGFGVQDRTTSGDPVRLFINNDGNVGIGTTAPSSRLDVTGGCITGSMCSDARLKEDIQPLTEQESYLEKVLRLRGVSFQWKDRPQMGRQIGLIAQEVETVLPEAVTTPVGETAQKGLSCTALDAALIEAIKEQQTAIKAQQAEIQALRQDLAAIQRTQSLSLVSNSSH